MKPPCCYAEWVSCLDLLRSDSEEEEVICAMEAGELSWHLGVAERFIDRIASTIDFRLKRTADLLQRDLDRSQGRTEDIARAVLSARRRLILVRRLAQLPVISEQTRTGLTDAVERYALTAQNALEDSAKQDRTGRIMNIVRTNALTRITTTETPVGTSHSEPSLPVQRRRAIILE